MVGRTPKRRRSGGTQHAAVFQPKDRPPTSLDATIQPSQQLDIHQATPISTRLDNSADAVDVSMAGWTPPVASTSGEMNAPFQIPDTGDPYMVSSVLQSPRDATSTSAATDHTIPSVQAHHLGGDGDTTQPCLHLTCSENGCISSIDSFSWSGLADEEVLPLSTTPGGDAAFGQLAPLARSSRMVPAAYRDTNAVARYPHAAMLMGIIDDLESCLQQTAPVDQVLNLNRTSMAKLPSIMEMEGFKACNSCPILAATVLDLVVGMYSMTISPVQAIPQEGEVSVTGSAYPVGGLPLGSYSPPLQSLSQPALTDIGNVTTSAPEASSAASQPAFAFGCLELEPEEQAILLNMVLKRDLRKCLEVIQSFRRGMQKRWEESQDNFRGTAKNVSIVSSSRAQEIWYSEIEEKAEELLQLLLARQNRPGGD